MTSELQSIGRANIVLCSENVEVDGIIAQVIADFNSECEDVLSFEGPGVFHGKTQDHIRKIIVPLVKNILKELDVPFRPAKLSLVNLGAASIRDKQLYVEGFSADVPIFLAMISLFLRIPLSMKMVSTGHISSSQGDIALVKEIPSKIKGAIHHPEIETFLLPELGYDQSIAQFCENEIEDIKVSMVKAKPNLKFYQLKSIVDIAETILNEVGIITSSLEHDYFNLDVSYRTTEIPYESFIMALQKDIEIRFWECISELIMLNEQEQAKKLISIRIQFQDRIQKYPKNFGKRFYGLVRCLPSSKKPTQLLVEYINTSDFKILANLMDQEYESDFKYLLKDFSSGEEISKSNSTTNAALSNDYDTLVSSTMHEIDETVIAKKILNKIAHARGSYLVESVSNYQEFLNILNSLYTRLLSSIEDQYIPVNSTKTGGESIQLLNRAFQSEDSVKIAWRQVKLGLHGGLGNVLNEMTNQYKKEKREEYIDFVLTDMFDLDNINEYEIFGKAIRQYFGPMFPKEFEDLSDFEIAKNYKDIILIAKHSIDLIQDNIRRII